MGAGPNEYERASAILKEDINMYYIDKSLSYKFLLTYFIMNILN